MSRTIRVALSETCNVFADMPSSVAELSQLTDRLDELRTANLRHHVDLIRRASEAGAALIGLGELFAAPYFALEAQPMWLALAEDALTGPTVTALRDVARAHAIIVVAPIYELDAETDKRFNTAVVIDEKGEILGKYRKTHIPAGSNEQGEFCETFYYGRSDGNLGEWPANISSNPFFPVFQTSCCRLGVAICYDRHFEGVMQQLAANGAELVVCPAVTFGAKSRRMWEIEFPVEAARHNVFIAGSNRRGAEPPWNQEYFGGSYFTGPNGRLEPRDSADELVVADLDLALLSGADPSGWDLERDLRPEIYRD